MEFHPVANLFPLLNDDDLNELTESIKANGQREPITLHPDGRIIDGRNRYLACRKLNMQPKTVTYTGMGDTAALIAYVTDTNLHRRHLTSSQKAMVAAKATDILEAERSAAHERMESGNPSEIIRKGRATERVASAFKTNSRYVEKAEKLIDEQPELAAQVESGTLTIPQAERIVKRAEIETRVNRSPSPLATGEYELLYVDPPWEYQFSETDVRSLSNQYPTMKLQDIKNLKIPASRDSMLFMWATSPKLEEAMEVLNAWGFTYKTCAVWVKDRIGMGYYFRQKHELLLVGSKGALPTPDPANRIASVLEAPRGKHSQKPEEMYSILESMYPNVRKVELFARNTRDGWDSWGNEL